jgi:serine/threonine protein kinase
MDVKCDNAVVSGISEGTAFNWQARLCDFNLAILDVSQQRQYAPDQLLGTPDYYPPEMVNADSIHRDNVFKIDIWCWGMLLWQVMVDNGMPPDDTNSPYLNENGEPIPRTHLHDMKMRSNFNNLVVDSCTKHLRDQYEGEEGLLIPLVRDLLQQSLQTDAADRPTASELLEQSVKQLEELMPLYDTSQTQAIKIVSVNER